MNKQYDNWKVSTNQNAICSISLDKDGDAVNTLNEEVLNELSDLIKDIKNNIELYKSLVITSSKKTGFCAGLDLKSVRNLRDPQQMLALVKLGQEVFAELASLSIPTIAVLNGNCIGGGLELALACDYRLALDAEQKNLGLPEVKVGILPAWGGVVRLPRLIGSRNALDLILQGKLITPAKAKQLGLVDVVVPERDLAKAVEDFTHNIVKRKNNFSLHQLLDLAPFRSVYAGIIRKNLEKLVKPQHYPAYYEIVDIWQRHGTANSAYQACLASAEKLTHNPTLENLIRVFWLRQNLKKENTKDLPEFRHVHVIGAGTMGWEIAAWCAAQGLKVSLQEREYKLLAPAIGNSQKLFGKILNSKRKIQAALDRIIPDVEGKGIEQADLIIEAIFENLEIKQKLFADIENRAKPNALIASNTSSILLEEINQAMQNKSRIVGIHFFNPASKMELVEVVRSTTVKDQELDRAIKFVLQIKHLPVVVKSSPGFLINRILLAYMMESMQIYEEGVAPEVIDETMLNFGMMMGPITLADKVGLDICLSVLKNLTAHYGGNVSDKLLSLVQNEKLGVKSGEGFYKYKNGKIVRRKNSNTKIEHSDLEDRMVFRLLNEAVICLHEKIVDSADDLDAGMIFGTGFAPFRGGPIHYARQIGIKTCLEKLRTLENRYGTRFKAHDGWNKLV